MACVAGFAGHRLGQGFSPLIRRYFDLSAHDLTDSRRRMIAETEAFLNWALRRGDLPRIPRRKVSDGGFTSLLRHPGARAAAARFWQRTLEKLPL